MPSSRHISDRWHSWIRELLTSYFIPDNRLHELHFYDQLIQRDLVTRNTFICNFKIYQIDTIPKETRGVSPPLLRWRCPPSNSHLLHKASCVTQPALSPDIALRYSNWVAGILLQKGRGSMRYAATRKAGVHWVHIDMISRRASWTSGSQPLQLMVYCLVLLLSGGWLRGRPRLVLRRIGIFGWNR